MKICRQRLPLLFCHVWLIFFCNEVDSIQNIHQIASSYNGGRKRPGHNQGINPNSGYNGAADGYPPNYEDSRYNPTARPRPPKEGQSTSNYRPNGDLDEGDDEDFEEDLVSLYTKSYPSKLIVAASAGLSAFILTHFLLLMILNHSIYPVLFLSAMICASFVLFVNGKQNNFAEFCRSLGVFTILLCKNVRIHTFLPKLIRQFNAAILFSNRKVFPPNASNSPWKYIPISENEDLQFSMTNTLLTMIITGAIMGWSIVKPIPLFPSWLGAIIGASSIGYFTTFSDARGDLLRFIGYTIGTVLSELLAIADDVNLRSRTKVVLSRLFFFLKGIDEQYHVMDTLKKFIGLFLVQFTSILYSMRGEVLNQGNANRDEYSASGKNGNDRRKGRPVGGRQPPPPPPYPNYEENFDEQEDYYPSYPPSEQDNGDQFPPYSR